MYYRKEDRRDDETLMSIALGRIAFIVAGIGAAIAGIYYLGELFR